MTSKAPSAAPSASLTDRENDAPAALSLARAGSAGRAGRALLKTYASILFLPSPVAGAFFLAATFVVPAHGLAGVLGLAAAEGWGRTLARPAPERADARLQGLLIGLALGLFFRLSWPLAAALVLGGLGAVLVTPLVRRLFDERLGLPSLALPFGLVAVGVLLAAQRWSGLEPALAPAWAASWGEGLLPAPLDAFVRALGATCFQLSLPAGALVLVGVALVSRWALVLAAVGFAAGAAVWLGLGGAAADLTGHLVGLNFVLVGVALGGAMVVLSPGSIALAAVGSALAAGASAALLAAVGPWHLPTLAFPFVVAVGLVVAVLRVRGPDAPPVALVEGALGTPERNLEDAHFRALRFAPPGVPVMRLPVLGEWVVTQGFHGQHTHIGAWAHAWDLEVADADGAMHREPDGGRALAAADFHCWGAPVLAPAAGTVVHVEGDVADNAVGAVDLARNWGNVVVLWHGGDVYSLLCHLQRGSVAVVAGQQVVMGQLLAKVGSSGRAPTPHLHFHVQRGPAVGAPTTPSLLWQVQIGVLGDRSGARRWETHAVPERGDTVRGLVPEEGPRRAFALPLGEAIRWRVTVGDVAFEETWRSTIDPVGARALESDRGSRLRVYADADHFGTFELADAESGATGTESLLALFQLAVPRVPLVVAARLAWSDVLPARPWSRPLGRLAQDLARPFVELGAVRSTSSSSVTPEGYRVDTRLDWSRVVGRRAGLPDRVESMWRPGAGLVALRAFAGPTCLVSAEVL